MSSSAAPPPLLGPRTAPAQHTSHGVGTLHLPRRGLRPCARPFPIHALTAFLLVRRPPSSPLNNDARLVCPGFRADGAHHHGVHHGPLGGAGHGDQGRSRGPGQQAQPGRWLLVRAAPVPPVPSAHPDVGCTHRPASLTGAVTATPRRDPMNLCEYDQWSQGEEAAIGFLRHSEIKHGRIAMFGFVGYIVQSNGIHWPWNIESSGLSFGDLSAAGSPPEQWDALSTAAKIQ
eukprot:scaffold111760_cov54-Phaeocystis_antarctica.AAC.2